MVDELEQEGLEVNRSKCLLYSTEELSTEEKRVCRKLRLETTCEGFVVLGSPVGSEDFITEHLNKEVQEVIKVLGRMRSVDALGKLNSKWASPQGLHTMLHD